MSYDEQPDGDPHGECAAEIARLTKELERAYRCIHGLHSTLRTTNAAFPTEAYHSLTIGAAKRYVFEGELDGSNYFEGKHVSVLHDALKLGIAK